MSWYVLTTPSLCYAPPTLPIALPIVANSSEATTITVVDTHPYPECAGGVGSNAKGGSRLFEPLKLSNYFGMCLGHMLGNQGFVHQDVADNQVHAEEGADALDSGDVENVALSTPGFMPTTGNSAPANYAAATYYSSASAPLGAAFSCLELQQATAVQAALGGATAAAQRATGHAAVMHYEVGDATAENITESDPHRVSHGVSSPTDLVLLGEFREEGTSDVEEPAVGVGACKADRFVADKAEEAVKGEKRGRGGEGERGRGGGVDLKGALGATADEEASLKDLLDQATVDDEEGVDSLYLCMPSLTLTFIF